MIKEEFNSLKVGDIISSSFCNKCKIYENIQEKYYVLGDIFRIEAVNFPLVSFNSIFDDKDSLPLSLPFEKFFGDENVHICKNILDELNFFKNYILDNEKKNIKD